MIDKIKIFSFCLKILSLFYGEKVTLKKNNSGMNHNLPNKVELPELSNNPEIKIGKVEPNEVFRDFFFYHFTKDQSLKNENKISGNIKESKFIIIDQNDIEDCKILAFEKTLVIMDQPIKSIIDEIKHINSAIIIFFYF